LNSLKDFKTLFLKDIKNSFYEITQMGLEPHLILKIFRQMWVLETLKVWLKWAVTGRLIE